MCILYDEVGFKSIMLTSLLSGGSTGNNLRYPTLDRVRSAYILWSPDIPIYGITLVILLLYIVW